MIKFDLETWKKRPDLYPMVANRAPALKSNKEVKLNHGDILIPRSDGTWHAIPEDVYKKIRGELS